MCRISTENIAILDLCTSAGVIFQRTSNNGRLIFELAKKQARLFCEMSVELGTPTRTVAEILLTANSPDRNVRRMARLMASSYLQGLTEEGLGDSMLGQALKDVIGRQKPNVEVIEKSREV